MRKFDHIERSNHRNVAGLTDGVVHVFPKLDGTNASVWVEPIDHPFLGVVDLEVRTGSRNREITPEDDNAGFAAWVQGDEGKRLRDFCITHPDLIVYGEWLVPHTIKTYLDGAWRRFWIFDVYDKVSERYLSYEVYYDGMDAYGFDVVPLLATLDKPEGDHLDQWAENNDFLMQDGAIGEGIVVKNYEWTNSFGRQPWLKVVRQEFKNVSQRKTVAAGDQHVEEDIANHFVTEALVSKTRAKCVLDISTDTGLMLDDCAIQIIHTEHRHKLIPMLLGRVYNDLVDEEMLAIIKKFKKPTIDFRKLNQFVTQRIKELAGDLF